MAVIMSPVDRSAQDQLRRIPSIDRLLADDQAAGLLARFPRPRVVEALRAVTEEWRAALLSGDGRAWPAEAEDAAPAVLWGRVERWLEAGEEPSLRSAINATGVVLHTGLGRAVMSRAAVEA